jgi:hypothetical protein
METQIQTYVKTKRGVVPITIFAYSTKGIPGLEITGLGKFSKPIKEKFIYLSKVRAIKVPKKRYILCVECDELIKECQWTDIKWFEFPLLLTYWHLAEVIKINTLADCISSGYVSSMGNVYHHPIDKVVEGELSRKLQKRNIKSLKYIGLGGTHLFYSIDSKLLLGDVANLKFN